MGFEPRATLIQLFRAGLTAVEPAALVAASLSTTTTGLLLHTPTASTFAPWDRVGSIYVVGGGKAAAAMLRGLVSRIGNRIHAGVVAVPAGTPAGSQGRCLLIPAAHPHADEGSRRAGEEIERLLERASGSDLVISLLSGGASAMISLPAPDVPAEDERTAVDLLLQAGADIAEVNTVRRHLSRIKGGRAAEKAFPSRVWSLVLSDVPGNDLATIASGPFAPDPTTFVDAIHVLSRRGIFHAVPGTVRTHLERGAAGVYAETPKPGDPAFQRVVTALIGSNETALEAVRAAAEQSGISHVRLLPRFLSGEARECAARFLRELSDLAAATAPGNASLLAAGGETSVTVRAGGKGGRNQEFALACVKGLASHSSAAVLSVGTDGIDGPTEAAGAYADHTTRSRAAALGLHPADFLDRNDSHAFFEALGDLVVTGPTGTNVADLALGLVER